MRIFLVAAEGDSTVGGLSRDCLYTTFGGMDPPRVQAKISPCKIERP